MMRKTMLVAVVALAGALLYGALAGPARTEDQPAKKAASKTTGSYVHTVIFHLKKDAPREAAQSLIRDAHELLSKIPSVRGLKAGRPAEMGTPDLARKDYQVGLLVLFDNFEGLQTYLKHPLHDKYVERNGKYIEMDKLLVYDFIDQKQ